MTSAVGVASSARAASPGATLVVSVFWLAAFGCATALLTRGYSLWTYEDVRRQQASESMLHAPPTRIETAAGIATSVFMPDSATSAADVYLVDFIYTRCETICSTLGVEFYQLQERIRASSARVRLLSISIDPDRDDVDALSAYGRIHRADAKHWTISRPLGSADLAKLKAQLGLIVIPDGRGGFVHNGAIHLIDGQRRLRAIYDHAQWPAALAHAVTLAGSGS